MKIFPLLILLLILPTISAISLNNTLDFAEDVLAKSNCTESLNITELVQVGIEQNQEKLLAYQKSPTCENLIEGSALYLKLAYPKTTCPTDFDKRIHEWIVADYHNWAFKNCGVNFTKVSWDSLVGTYYSDFYLGELEISKIQDISPYYESNYTYEPEQQKPLLGGGGIPDFDKNLVWTTWLFVPNWVWLELILLFLSYKIAGLFWGRHAYKEAETWFAPKNPMRNLGVSLTKRLKLLFYVFIVLNAILWTTYFLI